MTLSLRVARPLVFRLLLGCVCTAMLIVGVVPQVAGAEELADRPIVEVRIEGNVRTESETVKTEIRSKVGERPDAGVVRRDVERIFDMRLFEDVVVDLEETADGEGVVLIYRVKERPTIQKVVLEGNDEVSEEDIQKVLDVQPFSVLDQSQLIQNRQKIVDLYAEKGFFLTEVDVRVRPAEIDPGDPNADLSNERIVAFIINERSKVMVKRITFIGNEKVTDEDLKGVMQTKEGGWFSFISQTGTYRNEVFQRDMLIVQSYYLDNGYVKVKVGDPRVTLSPDKQFLYITVFVDEGEQYKIGKVEFSGDLIFDNDKLNRVLTTKEGEVFSRAKIARDIEDGLGDLYRDDGYAYVNVNPLTRANDEELTIDLNFEIEKGQKVYYERIDIVGNTKTRDKVIRRELFINEGELTNASRLKASKASINRLGYFDSVDITTAKGSDETKQVVIVRVAEKSTGQFLIGAGFSSVQNFFIQAQVQQNNLFGRGQTLQLSAQLSSLWQLFNVQFTEPYLFDSNFFLSAGISRSRQNFFQFIRDSTGGNISVGYPITQEWRLFLGYRIEYVSAEASVLSRQRRIRNLLQDGLTSAVSFTAQYDSRDNRLFPNSGMLHVLTVEDAGPWWGSENVFTRVSHSSRFYVPLFWKVVLKTQLRLGWVGSSSPTGVPIFERFFVGGINSVRGYFWNSISPLQKVALDGRDPQSPLVDFAIGGDKQLIFNLEIETPIVEQLGLRAVVFFDWGNAYNNNEFFFQDKGDNRGRGVIINQPPLGLFPSVGFGVRWFSPMGPLRFEWGFPLFRREDPSRPGFVIDQPVLFEFTIGNSF